MSELIDQIESHMGKYFENREKHLTTMIKKHIIKCADVGDWVTWVLVDENVWDNVARTLLKEGLLVTRVDKDRYKDLKVNMKISWESIEGKVLKSLIKR